MNASIRTATCSAFLALVLVAGSTGCNSTSTVNTKRGAAAGAVLGGVAGSEAGKAINTRQGYAYTVRFDSGEVKEIVQGADVYIAPGNPVNVTFRTDGVIVTPAY